MAEPCTKQQLRGRVTAGGRQDKRTLGVSIKNCSAVSTASLNSLTLALLEEGEPLQGTRQTAIALAPAVRMGGGAQRGSSQDRDL